MKKNYSFFTNGKTILTFLIALLFVSLIPLQVAAQLDVEHYIPPLFGREDKGDHYIVLSTPKAAPFVVTISDGAGNVIATPSISSAASFSYFLGSGDATEFLVSETELNTVVTGQGLILTAAEPFYVNLRVFANPQAGSLVSKGSQAAFGQDFYTGHMFQNSGQGWRKSDGFGIMATENNTTVNITNIAPGVVFRGTSPVGMPLTTPNVTVVLNAGDCYVMAAFMDEASANNNVNGVNGTHITSDKDIVVNCATWLGGNSLVGGSPSTGRDLGIDQIVPVSNVGDEYVLIKGEGIDNEKTIVVATAANTDIFLDGNATAVATLTNPGDYYVVDGTSFSANQNLYLTTSSPTYLYQMTNGGNGATDDNERQNGLMFLPPVGCSGGKSVFLPDVAAIGTAFINIIADAGANVYVDGVLQGGGDAVTGTSNYVTYKLTSGYTGDVSITSDKLIRVALINLSGNIGASGYFSGFTKDVSVQTSTVNGNNIALEGCINASFTFGIDAPAATPTTITYQVWGSATNGVDYSFIDTSVTIPAGQTQASIIINSIQDGITEGQESIFIVYQPDLCSPLDTAFLYIDDAQPIEFTLDETDLNCFNDSTGEILVNATGGFPGYTYQTTYPNGSQVTSTANPIIGLPAGTYSVQVFDIYGCKADALVIGGVYDADTTFLPDGSGVTYTTQIPIAGFAPGETIDSLAQILQICATMEHSYLGDLKLNLIAPSGQSVILKQQAGGGSCDLGEPIATAPVDGSASSTLIDPGTGYQYCWNSAPTYVTMVGESNNFSRNYTDAQGHNYTDTYLPAGSYQSFDPLSNLLGATMNGNWTLEITDQFSLDNGYIFEWNVSLVGSAPDTLVIIDEPDSIQMNGFITQAQCGGSDGAINFTVSGTFSPFTFLWSNGETTEDVANLSAGNYTVIVTDASGCTDSSTFSLNNISSMNITSTVAQVTCAGGNNGAIDVSASGGTAPYTFAWDNGASTEDITNLSEGDYLISITDDVGCQFSELINVGTMPSIDITLNNSGNEFCGQVNGNVDIDVVGGSGSYGYSWDNGASTQDLANITGGTYIVTVTDANSCQSTQGFTILNDVSNCSAYCYLTVQGISTDENCGDGTGAIDLTITQAAQPYIVSWSNGATTEDISGLAAGTYTVTVTDANQCTEVVNVVVGNNTMGLTIVGNQISNENCGNADGAVDITVSGGTLPYAFVWDNGATTEDVANLSAGNYVITITDGNGCIFSATYAIVNNTGNLAATTVVTNEICGNNGGGINLSVSGNAGTLSYLWSNGATTQDISGLSAGLYSVTITDANGCILTTPSYNVINESSTLLLTNTTINNENCNNGLGSIDITIQGGSTPITYLWNNGAITEDISGLTAGTYSSTITDANGCSVTTGTLNLFNAPGTLNVATDFITDEICNNTAGAIYVTTTGGASPITYSWSNGSTSEDISGLIAGAYTLTVTDFNGCTVNHNETVNNTSGTLQLDNAIVTDENCNNGLGAIDIFVSGGSTPYTYAWSNGSSTEDITALSAGNYSIDITDANGCRVAATYTIINNTSTLVINTVGTAEICSNGLGAIDLSVTGGSTPYTYVWSNGATTEDLTGISGGTYSCAITDNAGCTILTGNIIINNNPGTLTVNSTTTDESCGDASGSVILTAVGGSSPYLYSWIPNVTSTPGATGLTAGMYVFTVTDMNGCLVKDSAEVFNNSGTLSLDNVTVTDEMCNDGLGNIDIIVSGGATPLTFLWNNGATTEDITSLSAGIYSATITDANGCSINTGNINVSNNSGTLAIDNILIINEACGNSLGGINITIIGGATPYTYLWNNGATSEDLLTGLSAGNYTCTVTDAGGCSIQVQATVQNTQGSLYTISNVVTNESCSAANGSIDLNPLGGATPYSFLWSNGVTIEDVAGLTAGNYTVTITDAGGCTLNENFTIINNGANIAISSATINDEMCGNNAGGVDITLQGGNAPFTFVWSNGSSSEDLLNVNAGNYNVAVTDANGCTTNGAYTVIENTGTLAISNFVVNDESCGDANGFIDVTLAIPQTVTYSWSHGINVQDAYNLSAGSYTVTITDVNGCTVDSTGVVQNITGGFTAAIAATTDENCGDTTGTIDVAVTGGSTPYTFVWDNGAITEDLSNLSAGIYNVVVTDASGCSTNLSATITNISGSLTITNAVTNDENCGDAAGYIDLTVNGTATPFTYLWNNGAITQDLSGISSGIYNVVITDNTGCSITQSYTINNNSNGLNSAITMNDETCGTSDGNIAVAATGGIAPLTYAWTGGTPTNCCDYTLNMQDQGNSWNGASIDVIVDGNNVGNFTVSGGGANTETFNVCDGQSIELLWNAGTFDNEVSFVLLDAGGVTVFTQGASPTPGSIFTTTGACPSGPNNSLNNIPAGTYTVTITDAVGCAISDTVVVDNNYSFSTSSTINNENCGNTDGAIDLTVVGGATPFTYAWSNSATTEDINGITAGNYMVTTTDASGCAKVDSFTVSNTFTFTTSANITDENCGNTNGSIDLTTTGGTAPFTFVWSNGTSNEDLANVSAGTYTVTSTDGSGCSVIDTFTVGSSSAFTISSNLTDDNCNTATGAIDITTNGGSTPFTFAWSNGTTTEDVSALNMGNYSVTITDASGCALVDTFTIVNTTTFTLSGITTADSCSLGSGIVDVTTVGGATPFNYSWSNGAISEDLASVTAGAYTITVSDNNGCTDVATFVVNSTASFVSSAVVSNDSCGLGTGAIDVTIGNGIPCCSYTLDLTDSFNDGWDGASIDVEVNGVMFANVTINAGGSASEVIPVCDGDLLSLTYNSGGFENEHSYILFDANGDSIFGAVGPPTAGLVYNAAAICPSTSPSVVFDWSSGATTEDISNLNPGTYTVIMTDAVGNCSKVDTFTVLGTSTFTAVGVVNDENCGAADGAIDISVAGGISPYTFVWNNGATTEDLSGLITGNYSVTITDAGGCSENKNFTVNNITTYSYSSVFSNDSCGLNNGSIDITLVGGTAPFTIVWSNGETTEDIVNLSSGSYNVTITDASGCILTDTFAIINATNFTATGVASDASCTSCTDGAIDVTTAGDAPFTYTWSNGDVTEDVNNLSQGNYWVIITGNSGCKDSLYFIIDAPVGIDGADVNWAVNLYPNPATDEFTLTYNFKVAEAVRFTITNVIGEIVYDENIDKTHGEIKMKADWLEPGAYYIQLSSESNSKTLKLIIAR